MLSAQNIQTGNKMNKIALAAIFLSGVLLLSIFSVSASASQADELEKAMKVMRMLTGHEGTCTDLDADGDGKVAAGDAVLALRKAANISDMACGEGWTTIGDIPEYSFSSEPIIDENTAFTMNVDPFDQLMLTAVTTNGWTVEYFAVKDKMGTPVVVTKFHARKDDTGEYLEMKFDNEGHPVFIEQQGEKKVLLNWKNCTIHGEKDWAVIGELPDVASVPSPVIDDQAEVATNTDPFDPLWLTVTTNDGWIIKYFAEKNTDGSAIAMTFIQAEEIAGNNIIKTKMDKYGQPVRFSINDGKIVIYDWTLYEIRTEDGILQHPTSANKLALTADSFAVSNAAICSGSFIATNTYCNFFGLLKGPYGKVSGMAAGYICGLGNTAAGAAACPSSSPKLDECLIMTSMISNVVSLIGAASGVGVLPGMAVSLGMDIAAQLYCNKKYGNSTGDPHIYTLDRLKYDFQAVGEFVYLQSKEDPTEMTIQMRQGPWETSKNIAANKAVAMRVGGNIVEINVENTPRLSINNAPVTMTDKEVRQLSNGCKIYAENQRRYWVIWKDNSMAEVRTYSSHLDISVSLPDNRKGLVRGLLGNSDGDKTNDLQTRDGSTTFDVANKLTKDELYNQFGNSWRITQDESLFTYAEGKNTATYTDLNFPYALVTADDLSETVYNNAKQICLDAGITDPILLQDCILDVGLTGDSTFADNMKDLTPPDQSITVTDDWLLYEDAQKTEGEKIIHITADAAWQTGMALREGALNVDGDFEKTFTIYMGDNDNGADGMVFIMLPELTPAGTSLDGGGGLGFDSACDNKPCFGVEIDTYRNSSDPTEDHIALIKNGSVNHNSTENEGLPVTPLTFNIEDDATHTLTVSWNKAAQVFSVVLDGAAVITHEGLDLKTLLGTSTASYGFVGATGTATSEQYFYPVMTLPQP
jgi:hypothetical protein